MKIALITGGSRGIGAECVKVFAKEKYTVILNYNKSKSQAETLQKQLVESGCDVHLYQADVSNAHEVTEMFAWVQKYFKKIDVLVNNAGVWRGGLIQDVTEVDYDFVMDVNAKGSFLCCQQALPLLKQSRKATIVNVSSIWGIIGSACESVYSMSKFAVVGLTQSLSQELAGIVNVNCVCPPIVLTEMCAGYTDEEMAEFCKLHGKEIFTPQQVAQSVFILATEGSTGKILQL